MAYSIRTKYQLQQLGHTKDSHYIKQIYLRNKNWNPEPAPPDIEDKITYFDKTLKTQQNALVSKYKNINLRNLMKPQSLTLTALKENKLFVIKPTDKNLGPAIMDTEQYAIQVLTEQLLTSDYKQLSKEEAKIKMDNIKTQLKSLIIQYQQSLTKAEQTFFQQSFQTFHRTPIFYGLPKVHKTPVSLCPVVSSSSSFLSIFSTWLDFKIEELLPSVKSYIKNSDTLLDDFKNFIVPEGAFLFTANAKSMYTNIDTATGVTALRDFINCNTNHIPPDFPTELFLQILSYVMSNNIFTFGDTFWLQLSGTAMGTPATCSYATISYGQHENSLILPTSLL
jgi:hypothetical protein